MRFHLVCGLALVLLAPAHDVRAVPAPHASSIAPAPDDHVAELESAISTLLGNHALKDAACGVAILDVATGHYLATSGEHLALNPASNAKLYTAGAALALLHADHRYETSLSGRVRAGAAAQLVLRGHGDPSLTTADLGSMVDELRARGVRRVDGDIFVDQRFFDDQSTPPAFEQQPNEWAAFRAPVSAVAVNENTVTLSVRPTSVGNAASAWFDPPGFVDVDGSVRTAESGADTVVLGLAPNGNRLAAKISGAIAVDSRLVRYTRRVEDPRLLAGYVLKNLLERSDIRVAGDVKLGSVHGATLLAKHESEPLAKLLFSLGKASDNFYAEMIFKSLAGEVKLPPAKSGDAASIVRGWVDSIGAGDSGLVIRNGSGLFDANRVTAASVVQLLRAMWLDSAIMPEFVSQLAVGGVDGTLHKRFRNERAHRAIRAKTGTLEDTVALSGYVLGPNGKPPIAFSILMNHAPVAQARAAIDTLVELIADREWR